MVAVNVCESLSEFHKVCQYQQEEQSVTSTTEFLNHMSTFLHMSCELSVEETDKLDVLNEEHSKVKNALRAFQD